VGLRHRELKQDVTREIVRVVDLPHSRRPFRVHIDPLDDGATEVKALGELVRKRFYARVGRADLLRPAVAIPAPREDGGERGSDPPSPATSSGGRTQRSVPTSGCQLRAVLCT
jgi:hypothetical protein